jgi:2-phosphoglycerate kinase
MTKDGDTPRKKKISYENARVEVIGPNYAYNFSRGLLAHNLQKKGIDYEDAYNLAKKVQKTIISSANITNNVIVLPEEQLDKYIDEHAKQMFTPEVYNNLVLIDRWYDSSMPLIIILAGGVGTGTSVISKLLSERFSINQTVSSNSISQVLRKVIAPELAPELHAHSYDAYVKLRPIQSVEFDEVLIGYVESSRYVSSAVESLINRSIKEGISIIIRGEHLLPKYFSKKVMNSPNLIFFAINIPNSKLHLKRLLTVSDVTEQEEMILNFPAIRKISNYIIEQARESDLPIIDNSLSLDDVGDYMTSYILNRISSVLP